MSTDVQQPGSANWRSNVGFIFAAVGSAVGLGNIWKFPYITGEYGGGAFVLVYLFAILAVGLPLMFAELIIGKQGGRGKRKDVLGAMRELTAHTGPPGLFLSYGTGLLAVVTAFLILSFYSVVAGWAVHFTFTSIGIIPGASLASDKTFDNLAGNPWVSSLWHTVFMVLTIGIVAKGVQGGIERLCKYLMPVLIVGLVGLLVYVELTGGGLRQSTNFLFRPDFNKLTNAAVLEALGHAFFTLSLGMGAMVTYGAFLGAEKHKILRAGSIVAILDTVIALLAGLLIFAIVLRAGKAPSGGPGLLFKTLPELFVGMPGGQIFSFIFFLLVVFAAWSSAIALLQVAVAYFVHELGWTQSRASWIIGGVIWAIGIGPAYSSELFDLLDNLTTRYMLPIGGFCIAIAAGWLLRTSDWKSPFPTGPTGELMALSWKFLIRFVTPALLIIVLLWKAEILKLN